MIIDSRTIEKNSTIETDLCVVGAGVAGITLAQELAGARFRVCLLESGGLGPDNATQSLYWGENGGLPYYPLDMARACGFGGSGHRWNINLHDGGFGVRLHPLEELDFEEREWVPNSGWPFGKAHLDPFYKRAQEICKVGPFTYDSKDWADPEQTPDLPLNSARVKTTIFQFAHRLTFIEDHRKKIERAANIRTLTYANVTRLETDESAANVTRLRVRCLDGNSFWVKAANVILALGALETPRLLLLSNKVRACGLGNQNDLVGRYFMEHPHLWSGRFIPANGSLAGRTGLYRLHWARNTPIMGKLTVNEEVQRSEKILNYCVSIHPEIVRTRADTAPSWPVVSWPVLSAAGNPKPPPSKEGLGALGREARALARRYYRKVKPTSRVSFKLNHMSEQMPDPDSRLTLSAEKDLFGRRRIRLHWRVRALDMRTIIRSQQIIDQELRQSGLGRLVLDMKDESPPPDLHGGWHHMGTTRMHVDPEKGVVDQDGRVHGTSNLYIAGPSLFPTGGYANPVLTIVALSLRMADHIKRVMR